MPRAHSHQRLRVIQFPCCHNVLCWINHRLPNFCPECGKPVLSELRKHGENILFNDNDAVITYNEPDEEWYRGSNAEVLKR